MASALVVSLNFELVVFLHDEDQKLIGFRNMQLRRVDLLHLEQSLSSELLHGT